MSDAPAASPATQNFSDPLGVGGPLSTEPGAPGARPGKKTLLDSISVWDIFLFAFGFCIIASTCVFIALFVYQKGVNGQLASHVAMSSTCPDNVGCIQTSSQMLSYKDNSYDPCSNFYNYACNGFRRKNYSPNVITGTTSTASLLNDQRVNLLSRIMRGELTTQLTATVFNQQPELLAVYQKLNTYYGACSTTVAPNVLQFVTSSTATQAASQLVVTNAVTAITSYVQTNVVNLVDSDPQTLQKLYTSMYTVSPNLLAQIRGLDTVGAGIFPTGIFDVITFAKYVPSITPVLALVPAFLPSATNFADTTAKANYQSAVSSLIAKYLFNSIYATSSSDQFAAGIVALESQLSSIWVSRPVDYSATWTQTSINDLQAKYPNIMGTGNPNGWYNFFSSLQVSTSLLNAVKTAPSDTFAIHVSSIPYFTALNTVMANTPAANVRYYAAYMELLQLAAVSQMHGVTVPSITYTNIPVGFDPYAQTSSGALLEKSELGSQLTAKYDQVKMAKLKLTDGFKVSAFVPVLNSAEAHAQVSQMTNNVLAPMDAQTSSLAAMVRNMKENSLITEESLRSSPKEMAILESITNNICVQDVMEKFPLAMGRFYAPFVLSEDTRNNVKGVVSNVKAALRARVADPTQDTWLDDQSRSLALGKLDAMTSVVGFPDSFLQTGFISTFYAGILNATLSSKSFFFNAVQAISNINLVQFRIWSTDYTESSLELFQDWTQVNAYNALAFNKIVIPMGFLQPSVFKTSDPLAVNYGTIGYIAGHEMAHAFSPTGLQYNNNGAQQSQNMLSTSALSGYNSQQKCFANFYNQNSLFGIYMNGTKNFPDNFADHVGLKAGWDAYQSAVKSVTFPVKLPGLVNYTDSQLFYLGFSQLYCDVSDTSLMKTQQAYSSHPIPFFRVTSSLSLLPGFQSAYSCAANSAMSAQAGSCTLFKREFKVTPKMNS